MVPLVTVPPDVARLDGDDVGMRIRDIDDDGTLDLLVITDDRLVERETDPLVEALWSAAAWTTEVSFGSVVLRVGPRVRDVSPYRGRQRTFYGYGHNCA